MVQPLIVGNNDYGYPVSLTQERRANGMYIIGMNGMGKSVTMLSMLIQDIEQGRGLCLIDPHGDLVRDTMAYIPETRHDDVTLFDTRNPNLIPAFDLFAGMQASNVIERSEQISRVVAAFLKAAPSTNAHRMENLLRLITIAFLDTPGYTLAEMPLLIGNESFRSFLGGKVKDPQVRDDWARFAKMTDRQWEEYTESSMTRIRKFTTDPLIKLIIGQQGKAIDFRHAMDTGRIVLIKMPRNEEMANLLGTLLVDRLLAAALSRDKLVIKDRRLFSIYVDEFARFQTDDFPRFFTEGRKYGVPTTVAHQARWQLGDSDQAPRAAHNWLLFKCEFEDATVLGRGIPAPYEEPPKPLSPEGLAWRRLFDTFGYVHFKEVWGENFAVWQDLTPDEIYERMCFREGKPFLAEKPTRPPAPENPWQMLTSQGHSEVDIALLSQAVAEGIGELEDAWRALAQARNYSSTRAAFDREAVRDDYQWVDTIRESLTRDLGLFLRALAGDDEEGAWNNGFRIVRDDVRWRGLEWAGSARLLRELGLRTDHARVADKLLKDIEQLGKRWQKHYHWEEPVNEEQDADEEDEYVEPKQPTQREFSQRLSNLPQFHFLFRYLNEWGGTETVWAKTKIPAKPPANPHLDGWIAEWSRQSGAPPDEIEAEIRARQAPFRDGAPAPAEFYDGPPQPKATPFKRPY